jgi:hypothetical protein
MIRPGRTLRLIATCVAGGLAVGACGGTKSAAPTTLPPATTTPTSSLAPSTTATTAYAPSSPQPSPEDAAARLVATWAAGNRTGAGGVAAPAAVATLFATPYPAGDIQPRGCTNTSVSPGTCTYRNTLTDAIYEIGVVHAPGGWYVATVTVET